MAETIMRPLMSGHCSFPAANTLGGMDSHERCQRNGGGQRANPAKAFQPCPCPCHFVNDEGELEVFECGGCGRDIMAAPHWPLDADGDVRYTHVDPDGRAIGEDCAPEPKAKTRAVEETDPERDCIRCGTTIKGATIFEGGDSRLCLACNKAEQAEREAEDDFSDLDDEDDFSDLDDL